VHDLFVKVYLLFNAMYEPNRATVICPIIDVISDDTFEYITGSDMTWGGFNWKMNFRWYSVPQRELDRRHGDRSLPLQYVDDNNIFRTFLVWLHVD